MQPTVLLPHRAALPPSSKNSTTSSRKASVYGWWLLYLLLLLNYPLWAQQYVYQRQIGSEVPGLVQFNGPSAVAVDISGNLYVADGGNHRIVKVSPSGRLLFRFGSQGSGNQQFQGPSDVAVNGSGNVYVVDAGNHRIVKVSSSGRLLFKFGSQGSGNGQFQGPSHLTLDGAGHLYVLDDNRIQKFDSAGRFLFKFGSGQFFHPNGLAVDSAGNVYVSDGFHYRIQKFDSSGRFLAKIGSYGIGDGQFSYPTGVAVDGKGNIYVSDANFDRIQKFDSSGRFLLKFGSQGSGEGQFNDPLGLAVDGSGNVYVADNRNHRIQKFDSTGGFQDQFGSPGAIRSPGGVAVDGAGNLYVSEASNHRVQKFDSEGRFLFKFSGEGTGEGQFYFPAGLAVDGAGNLYVADNFNNRIQKFDSSGRFLLQFGSDGSGEGQFQRPVSVAVDGSGNLYVADASFSDDYGPNHRIQKFTSSGHFLGQFGGYGAGEGQFQNPQGVVVDGSGHLYVSDLFTSRIQKFDSSFRFLTQFDISGDGMAVDGSGNLYVADGNNHRIQKFDSSGRFLTQFGSQGTGNGQFQGPVAVTVDHSGTLYVADQGNNRVQVFASLPCPGVAFTPAASSALPPATVGIAYRQVITTAPTGYSFTATGLPPGLSISPEGLITGTPTGIPTSPDSVMVTAIKGACQAKATYWLAITRVVSFTLIDARTGKDIQPLKEGDVLNLLVLRQQLSVRANTDPPEVGSVVFGLNDKPDLRVENFAPYALASNNPDDSYVPYAFQVGDYVLSATPYSLAHGQGEQGSALTVHFQVVNSAADSSVASFTLINAATGQDIQPLQAGDVLDLSTLPPQLSVRANTKPVEVGSVVFGLNDQPDFQVENFVPYALASNQPDGRFLLQFGSEGGEDGQFRFPVDVAVDGSGNLYVADRDNNRIQKFDSEGRFLFQIGSYGSGEGQLNNPSGVAVDGAGNLYVAELNNNRIQKFDSTGRFLTQIGSYGNGEGQLNSPYDVAVDGAGNLYVIDFGNGHRIQKLDSSGRFLAQIGSYGSDEGMNHLPTEVAVDDSGNVYVAEGIYHQIQKFDSEGRFLFQFGSPGGGEGQFRIPTGVAVDSSGNVYVADESNYRIQKFDSRGRFLSKFGSRGSGKGQFQYHQGLAIDGSGHLYVADAGNHRIQVFSPSGSYLPYAFQVGEYALSATPYSQANGQGRKGQALRVNFQVINSASENRVASFTLINTITGQDIQPLQAGDVLDLATLPDQLSIRAHTVPWKVGSVVFGLNEQPTLRVENAAPYALAGTERDNSMVFLFNFGSPGSGEGQFQFPNGVAFDGSGNFYVSDQGNHRIQVFSPSGRFLPYPFQTGDYVLSATPYSQANGQGDKGLGRTVNFQVVNSASTARTSVGEGAVSLEVEAYPNPFSEKVYAVIKSVVSQPVAVYCYDAKGVEVGKLYEGELAAGQAHQVEVDGRTWPDGLYFLRINTSQEQLVKKVMLQRK